ncbi:MAG TPA: hypothetical protein VIC27_06295 [Ktedonobacterales bacterium]
MSLDISPESRARAYALGGLRAPRGAWLAWSLLALALLAAGPMVYFASANDQTSLADDILSALLLLIFAGMGALIASRRPSNAVGWLLCLVALCSLVGNLGLAYAVDGLVLHPGSLPGAYGAAIVGGVTRSVGWYYMLTLFPLYFPTGKLLTPRWRWTVWAVAAASLAIAIGVSLGKFGDYTDTQLVGVRNPIAILPGDSGESIAVLATVAFFIVMLCSAVSVVLRFRRARGIERQQLKWFAYAMALAACGGAFFTLVAFFSLPINLVGSVWFLVTIGMPIAAGIAILRYRLYDIDIIINRTLVYGSLTVILAALYFGLVIGAQTLSQALTGKQVGQQPVVIVLSTLLIAALAQPLRARLQRWIDRRFYRSRYDAAKTVAAFSAALRSEVDLEELNTHLLAVVEQTMRPAHASLWLRSSSADARGSH